MHRWSITQSGRRRLTVVLFSENPICTLCELWSKRIQFEQQTLVCANCESMQWLRSSGMKLKSSWCAESWETSVAKEWALLESQIAGSSGQWYKVDYYSILYHHPNDTFSLILFSHFLILWNHKAIVGLKNLKLPVVIGFSWSELKNSLEDKWHSNPRNQVNRHVNLTESGRQLHRSCYLYTKSHFSVFDIQRRWEQSDEVNISRTSHYEDRSRDRTAPSTENVRYFKVQA